MAIYHSKWDFGGGRGDITASKKDTLIQNLSKKTIQLGDWIGREAKIYFIIENKQN